MTRYSTIIKTLDKTYAGTDSQIYITLYSNEVASAQTALDNYGNDFEPGDQDEYFVDANFNGPITAVEVANDGGDAWVPEWVQITDPVSKIIYRADFPYRGEYENGIANSKLKENVYILSVEGKDSRPAGQPVDVSSDLNAFAKKVAVDSNVRSLQPMDMANGLIQMLDRVGFKSKFVSIGGAVSGGVVGLGGIEGGVIYAVDNHKLIGSKAAEYFTATVGWETGWGVAPAIQVAAWEVPDINPLRKWAYCKSANVKAFAGLGVGLIWSADDFGHRADNKPRIGVQLVFSAGADFDLGAGETWDYTWLW